MQGVECDSSDRLRMLSEHRPEALNSIHSVKGNSWKSDKSLSLIEQQELVRWREGKAFQVNNSMQVWNVHVCAQKYEQPRKPRPPNVRPEEQERWAGLRSAFAFALAPPSFLPHSEI